MPQTVTVPLLCSFEHEGRYVAAGESITVTPLEAAQLARRNIVSLTKQTYTHRAMVADYLPALDAAVEVSQVSPPTFLADAEGAYAPISELLVPDTPAPRRRRRKPADTPDAPEKPKRRYRRRNLTAGD